MRRSEVLGLSVLIGALALGSPPAPAQTPIVVEVQRDGGTWRMQATVLIDAAPEVVWGVLTDYEGQLRFVRGLTESRVVSRDSTGSIVVQKGSVEVMFIRFRFETEFETRELPPRLLTSHVIRGSVKRMISEYRLSPDSSGTRLDYAGEVEPGGWLAQFFGPLVIRREVEAQIGAMVQEIMRRRPEGR